MITQMQRIFNPLGKKELKPERLIKNYKPLAIETEENKVK
jgi:hypothetical protein